MPTWIPLTVDVLHPVSVHVSMRLFCNLNAMMIPLLINMRIQTINYTHNRAKSRDDSNILRLFEHTNRNDMI